MNKKEIGEYYTPEKLVISMVEKIGDNLQKCDILEPSVGDGRFLNPLLEHNPKTIDCIELFQEKCNFINKTYKSDRLNVICSDFIDYSLNSSKKYDFIIGNPPYIKKSNIDDKIMNKSKTLLNYFSNSKIKIENIWVSFILGAVKLLKTTGSIFFILPFEFLQVCYSEELRLFLEEKFNKIEITVFNKKVFPIIEQDVCLLYMTNDKNYNKEYIVYKIVEDENNINKPIYESKIMKNKPLKKWTNSIISDEETELLKKKSNIFMKISNFGDISPGIVTGNNDYFIKNKEFIEITESPNLPIISKSVLVGSKLIFLNNDFRELVENNKKVFLLKLNQEKKNYSSGLIKYIKNGEKNNINKTYKCSTHKPWYNVPIIKKGDILFFKRYHLMPRLVINEADVYTTDISYNIRLKKEFNKESFGFCFYNSLTLVMAEYYGRFYGGGVCELIPSEFKALPLPYKKINSSDIKKLDKMIRNNASIEKITDFVDSKVLNDFINKDELVIIKNIRNKLISRRLK